MTGTKKNNISKLLREANDRVKVATKKEQENAARFLKADKIERGEAIKRIADEFDGADIAKLTALCEATNIFSEEQIRLSAASIWTKKFMAPVSVPAGLPAAAPAAVPTQPPAYSGVTNGGQGEKTYQEKLDARYPSMVKK